MQDEYLPLSGIQHFVFCRRQWALIHIEQQWQENVLTAEGRIQHEKAHDAYSSESRGNLIISRGMRVVSHCLRLQGACDVVEFHRDEQGVELHGREGRWVPFPVEYKHGQVGIGTQADQMQLCCQAMCLEEMLLCPVPQGALFYEETRRREPIVFTDALKESVRAAAAEMNELFERGHTPQVKRRAGCKRCSMKEACLPQLLQKPSVSGFIRNMVREAAGE